MRNLLLAALVTIAAVLAACVGPTFVVQQYGGPARPRETIAILRVNGSEPVRLLVLDDEDVAAPIASDGRLHIELLPGRHTLTARNGDDPRAPSGSLAFEAKANEVYRVVFAGDEPRLFVVGRGSDKPAQDVTLPAVVEAPRPRLPPPGPLVPPTEIDAGTVE